MERSGGIIHEQSRRLGISADWERHKFTLDPGPSSAVRSTFVSLYEKGLIYRHERIINRCVRCATALSDLEVDYDDVDGHLYHIRYPLEDEPGRHVTVATTRPETMLGDTGVAVHPDDPRYDGIRGRNVVLPIMGRVIPVVGDEAIDPEFGTGALKVTPAHDPIDFEVGQRHRLDAPNVIGEDGNMTHVAGKYAGVERFEARRRVVEELDSLGALEKVEAAPPFRRALPALRHRRGAAHQHAVVRQHRQPRAAGQHRRKGLPGGHRGRDSHRARTIHPRLPELAGEHTRLVHQPPAVVGTPHTRLVL